MEQYIPYSLLCDLIIVFWIKKSMFLNNITRCFVFNDYDTFPVYSLVPIRRKKRSHDRQTIQPWYVPSTRLQTP